MVICGIKIIKYTVTGNTVKVKIDKGRWKPTIEFTTTKAYLLKALVSNATGKMFWQKMDEVYPGSRYSAFRLTDKQYNEIKRVLKMNLK